MFNYVYFKLHINHVVDSRGTLNAMEEYVKDKVCTSHVLFYIVHCKYSETRARIEGILGYTKYTLLRFFEK